MNTQLITVKNTSSKLAIRETRLIDEYPVALLHSLLEYNPDTGIFRYRARKQRGFNNKYIGQIAGRIKWGYVYIKLMGKEVMAHQIAWKMTYGDYIGTIDHINRLGHDCRIKNLRICLAGENCWNRGMSKNNTSGIKGVSREGNGWRASISQHGIRFNLGYFKSLIAAGVVRRQAEIKMFGAFAPF